MNFNSHALYKEISVRLAQLLIIILGCFFSFQICWPSIQHQFNRNEHALYFSIEMQNRTQQECHSALEFMKSLIEKEIFNRRNESISYDYLEGSGEL